MKARTVVVDHRHLLETELSQVQDHLDSLLSRDRTSVETGTVTEPLP